MAAAQAGEGGEGSTCPASVVAWLMAAGKLTPAARRRRTSVMRSMSRKWTV